MKNVTDSMKSGNLMSCSIGKHRGWCGSTDHLAEAIADKTRFCEVLVERPERIEHGGIDLPDLAWDLFDLTPDHLSVGLTAAAFYATKFPASDDEATRPVVFFRVITDKSCAGLIRQLKSGLLFFHGDKTPDGYTIDHGTNLFVNEGDGSKLERIKLTDGNRVEVLSTL